MNEKEIFDKELEIIRKQLINDKKLIYDNEKYKLRTYIDYIISNYDCEKILNLCSSKEELKYCIINNDNPFNHYCISCNKKIQFNDFYYPKSCRTKECLCNILLNNQNIKDKHQFIIDNYLNGNKKFNDIQIGFIEKYGVYSNSQLKDWHNSIVKTWKSKTEEELIERKNKTIATCRIKYGCDFSQQNPNIIQKQSNTWHNKSKEELELKDKKRKETTFKKYGVDHIMKSQEVINNIRERHFKEYGYYSWLQKNIEHKDIYFDDVLFKTYIKDKYKENNNIRIKKSVLDKYFNVNVLNRCKELNLLKYIQVFDSDLENRFKKLFDDNNIKYEWRNRSIIDGPNGKSHCYELDFYLPDYKIGIEINDISNHNAISQEKTFYGKKYHLYKTNNCKEKGIRLIHIWEWEIKNNFEKLSFWLLNELNIHKNILYARKCILKNVNVIEEKEFLNKYHLQNYTKSDIAIGLYYNDELIEIMTFSKPRFNKKYEYELLRLCTKYNYIIVGGNEKLFKYFLNIYNPQTVISYCDYSKFIGNSYLNIGMDFVKLSNPTITYCDYNMKTINESILIKYGIDNLLGTNYGKNTNNKELIVKEGFLPVYNCGNLIFEYIKI